MKTVDISNCVQRIFVTIAYVPSERYAAGSKVELCAGDAKVSSALRQCGFMGKEFDVSWLEGSGLWEV